MLYISYIEIKYVRMRINYFFSQTRSKYIIRQESTLWAPEERKVVVMAAVS